jgi:hypothetical protein
MMTLKAGVVLCSLLCATAAISISAAAEHAAAEETHFYTPGHRVYAHELDLEALHANIAAFIERTKSGMAGQSS